MALTLHLRQLGHSALASVSVGIYCLIANGGAPQAVTPICAVQHIGISAKPMVSFCFNTLLYKTVFCNVSKHFLKCNAHQGFPDLKTMIPNSTSQEFTASNYSDSDNKERHPAKAIASQMMKDTWTKMTVSTSAISGMDNDDYLTH
jgi:hypothetical protein